VKPGGFFYIYEGHPILWAADDERADREIVLRYPYFEASTPHVWETGETYVDGPPMQNTRTYEWNHGLGEIATALIDAGLRIEFIHEFREVPWQALPWMESMDATTSSGRYQARNAWQLPAHQRDTMPLMYSIRASRPA